MRTILNSILNDISSNNDTPSIIVNKNIEKKYITKLYRYKKPRAIIATKDIAEL